MLAERLLKLEVDLTAADHLRMTITPPPALPLRALLHGRDAQARVDLISRLFSVCRRAQGITAARLVEAKAVAAGQGEPAAEQLELRRDELIRLEWLHEHLWLCLLQLPKTLALVSDGGGEDRHTRALASCSQTLQRLMQAPATANALTRWHVEVVDNLRTVKAAWQAQCEQDLPLIREHLYALDWDWPCTPAETGPRARAQQGQRDPSHATGVLLSYFDAIVAEVDHLLDAGTASALLPVSVTSTATASATDRVWVTETARGRLQHRETTREHGDTDYEICAPTDQHFAPNSWVVDAVQVLDTTTNSLERCRLQVEALVALVNPCVRRELIFHA